MRVGWEIKTLNEVCKELFAGGDVPKDRSSKFTTEEYNIPIFSNGAKNDGLYGYTDIPRVKDPSITVSARGTIGYSSVRIKPYLPVVRLIVLIPDKELITLHFLKYVIESMDFSNSGTSIPQLTVPMIKKYNCSIPPLSEQKQIVAILDKAFTAIDQAKTNIEKNIANTKELFQSKLNDIFSQKGQGWEEKTLGELGKVSMCKRILKKQTTPNGEIPFYKIGTFGKVPNAFISKEIYDEFRSKYSFPKKGDILLSASGTIGRRVIYNGEPAYFQDSNIVWIDNNEELVTNEYLYQFYGVCDFNPSKGATISRLYNADLRKIKISFPSIDEQKVIIPKMIELSNQTHQIESNYKLKIEDLEELKKSILQKAFAGELTKNAVTI
jgi:type I restriction enzyme S subunit